METFFVILVWVLILGGGPLIKWLLGVSKAAAKAAAQSSQGKGSFAKNFKDSVDTELHGMGPLQLRGVEDKENTTSDFHPICLEVKGLFPVKNSRNGAFVISMFDITESPKPGEKQRYEIVLSKHESFQESKTLSFQSSTLIGEMQPNYGFARWVRVGVAIPEILQPPHYGHRKFRAWVRLIDSDKPPAIRNGFHDPEKVPGENILWSGSYDFDWKVDAPGWLDELINNRESARLVVKIAVAVAMIDANLSDSEGALINNWMKRKLSTVTGELQNELRDALNSAFKEAYHDAAQSNLSYSTLTGQLSACKSRVANVECVDLVYAVISADGTVNREKIAFAKRIAEALDVDRSEIEKIADRALASSKIDIEQNADLEDVLGIDRSWNTDEIRKYLRTEFQKWNNRLPALADGPERENAQRRLMLISEARDKYK